MVVIFDIEFLLVQMEPALRNNDTIQYIASWVCPSCLKQKWAIILISFVLTVWQVLSPVISGRLMIEPGTGKEKAAVRPVVMNFQPDELHRKARLQQGPQNRRKRITKAQISEAALTGQAA